MPEPMSALNKKQRERFGAWMKTERESLGLSLQAVAEKIGRVKQWVHQMERGDAAPTRAMTLLLARALDADPDIVLARAGYLPDDLTELLSKKPELIRAILEFLGLPRERPMPDFTTVKGIAKRMMRPDLTQGGAI